MGWTPARSTGLLLVGVLVLGACGGPAGGQAGPSPEPLLPSRSTTIPSTAIPTTTVPGSTTTAAPERPLAPDFTLQLGAGGSFTLSEEARPVYLVFWAEW